MKGGSGCSIRNRCPPCARGQQQENNQSLEERTFFDRRDPDSLLLSSPSAHLRPDFGAEHEVLSLEQLPARVSLARECASGHDSLASA